MKYIAAALGCLLLCHVADASDKPNTIARDWLGGEITAIVEGAEKIETFRIREDFATQAQREKSRDKRIAGRLLLGQGKNLTKQQQTSLQKLVLSDSSYEWKIAKGCEPTPGVVFRIHHKDRYVDIVVCFECRMWGFVKPGGGQEKWEDFDPVAQQLVKLAKAAFPNDKVIQGL